MARYAPLWPYLRWAIFAIGAVYCIAAIGGRAGWPDGGDGIVAGDALNYWQGQPYSSEHYRYSPAFYWLTLPGRALPFDVFAAAWAALHLAAVAWLGPWTILLAFDDVIRGNVSTFLAVAVVLAVRGHAWAWAAVLLTKVTPGVGIAYHVGRRDWRAVVIAIGATLGIVAIGSLIDSHLWIAWLDALRAAPDNYQTVDVLAPLPVRLAVGAALCLAAARYAWLLPVGMIVAMPGLWPSSFALLAAIPRLYGPRP